ncbi:MAG: radical SAM protein [Oscillospiraceae bacterium]|nr:radical SAM protein [Oscillospiraceae bacterium]
MIRRTSEPQFSTYFHSRGRALGLPIAGNFELTARCNFNCPMCYIHHSKEQIAASGRKELTAEQWLGIAESAKNNGMIFALLTGGEPLLREDFFEIYGGMKKMGLMISINTNGSLLKGEILERFLKDPPFRFNISLYGGCNETYERMCGRPVYELVKENIRTLKNAGVEVSLNLSVTPYNCGDLERIYKDAEELDVGVKMTTYMYPPVRIKGDGCEANDRLSAHDAAKYTVMWDKLRLTDEMFAQRAENMAKCISDEPLSCPMEEGEGVRCRAGSSSFWMTWDGKMLPCGLMTEPAAYPLEVGFDNAWKTIREKTAEIRMPSKCAACGYKDICGVCAAVCSAETGAFDAVPEYVCEKICETVRITQEYCSERNL